MQGGDDLNDEGDTWEILTDPAAYEAVANAVKAAKVEISVSEITMIASTYTKLEGSVAAQMIRLLEALEDLDDVQNVYSNFDLDATQYEEVAGLKHTGLLYRSALLSHPARSATGQSQLRSSGALGFWFRAGGPAPRLRPGFARREPVSRSTFN